VIQNNKWEQYHKYIKYHALICKFMGIWKLKGQIDLKLGSKGFFTMIFTSLEDKERVFENWLYLFYNFGLFMRLWEGYYILDQESIMEASIWV